MARKHIDPTSTVAPSRRDFLRHSALVATAGVLAVDAVVAPAAAADLTAAPADGKALHVAAWAWQSGGEAGLCRALRAGWLAPCASLAGDRRDPVDDDRLLPVDARGGAGLLGLRLLGFDGALPTGGVRLACRHHHADGSHSDFIHADLRRPDAVAVPQQARITPRDGRVALVVAVGNRELAVELPAAAGVYAVAVGERPLPRPRGLRFVASSAGTAHRRIAGADDYGYFLLTLERLA